MPSYTWQPDETNGIDTWMNSNSTATNYGTGATLQVGESNAAAATWRTLLKPDLSESNTGAPANAEIVSLTINLWVKADLADNTIAIDALRILVNWNEAQATWTNRLTATAWNTAGCGGSGTDYYATALGTANLSASVSVDTKISIALNGAEVKKMRNGTYTDYGFLLKGQTETNNGYHFYSSTEATAGKRPEYVLEWTTAQGSQVITFF